MLKRIPSKSTGVKGSLKSAKSPEIIAVTSGKGGVGKSFMSVNSAILLRQIEQKKVLLIDTDIHMGNVDLILGIRPNYTIADVVKGKIGLEDAIVNAPGGIDILPASGSVVELLEMEDTLLRKLSNAFARYEHDYDIVLLDTGAGIAQTVISFLLGADKILLIVTPDPASIADAYAVIKIVRHFEQRIPIVLMINLAQSFQEGDTLFKKMNVIVRKFLNSSVILGGVILRDDLIAKSVKFQRPFSLTYQNTPSGRSLRMINQKLIRLPVNKVSQHHNFFERFMVNRKISMGINL